MTRSWWSLQTRTASSGSKPGNSSSTCACTKEETSGFLPSVFACVLRACRYLVERQCAELWAYVLRPENNYRRSVIDQVVSSALPESSSADEVSAAVNAFISAQLPQELTELLEKIVLHNSDFSSNQNLQNLLILTAIKAEPSRVMGYINRLQNFDGAAIAQVALENGLREEALTIYRKFGLLAEAADTLLEAAAGGGEQELERAQEFAQRCGSAEVWRKLGRAQLRQARVVEAVDSLIKANDGEVFKEVVEKATEQGAFEALADYLLMARKSITIKDQTLDSELLYSYAMTERLEDLEMFLNGPNTANVQAVGDRLFEQGRYQVRQLDAECLVQAHKALPTPHGVVCCTNTKGTFCAVAYFVLRKRMCLRR